MTFEDRDLADALTPLAGDPAEDASRVLAALSAEGMPTEGPAPHGGPLRAWPWIAAAAAAGILLGTQLVGRPEPEVIRVPGPTVETLVEAPPLPIVRHAAGDVVLETDAAPEPLRNGDRARFDHVVATLNRISRVFVEQPNATELRLDGQSRLIIVDESSLSLQGGRVWMRVPKSAGRWGIDTKDSVISAGPGTYQVSYVKGATTLVVFEGEATISNDAGEENLLTSDTVCGTRQGALGSVEPLKDRWRRHSWQIDALANCVDYEEAIEMAVPLAMDLSKKETHRFAAAELRRIGAVGSMALSWALFRTEGLRGPARPAAVELLSNIAEVSSLLILMDGLMDDAPKIRGQLYETVVRLSGEREKDREFWETASSAERFDALQKLREKLKGF